MISLSCFINITVFLIVLCAIFPIDTSANVAEFLARQRQLAEEQWNSNEEGLKYEEDEEEEEGGGAAAVMGGSEYQYMYVDENGNYYVSEGEEEDDEDDEDEDVPVFIPKKKKFKGYKKYVGRSLRKCDPYIIEDVLLEIEQLVKCPIRNESTMIKLRDDHQLNLRIIKKEIQEKRKGQMPTLQLDPTMPNQKKAALPKKEVPKELETGIRVMARYQGKTKYVHGTIKDKRKGVDGAFTYDIKYDNGKEEARVPATLIITLESEEEKAKARKAIEDERNRDFSDKREKGRQSFKEMQEERRRRKEEEYRAIMEDEKDPGRLLESDCESQVCMACKFVADEFADKIHKNIDNYDVEYLYDLVDFQQPFCESPQITQRYTPVVKSICEKLLDEDTGYRDFFVKPFEDDTDWANVRNANTLLPKKEHICVNSGMCDPVAFEFEILPEHDWGSDECFVCHALIDDLEDKVFLQQKVTEGSARALAKSGCDNLKLPESLAAECRTMTEGKLLDDIGWILKLFKEAQERKEKSHRNFADSACEEIQMCEKWVDPTVEAEPEIEAIYS